MLMSRGKRRSKEMLLIRGSGVSFWKASHFIKGMFNIVSLEI